METSGPALARDAMGPLRRLLAGKDHPPAPITSRRWIRIRPYAIPLGVLALLGIGLGNGTYMLDTRSLIAWLGMTLGFACVLPIAVVFRRPLLAWRLSYLMMFLSTVGLQPTEAVPWPFAQLVAYIVTLGGLALTQPTGVVAWATALGLIPIFGFAHGANAIGTAIWTVVIALIGDMLARRRQSRRLLAEQTELSELERARRTVLEERARIAREMHDVVAHHMSMIAVQAETAPFRHADLPESARTELTTIAGAARDALTDMRKLLGVLRAEDTGTPRAPQPGIADVPELVAAARRAGVTVAATLPGPDGIPPDAGLAAYRIVQEALANAARHTPGGPVRVECRVLDDHLEVRVENGPGDDVPAGAAGPGLGLIGMRERAELLGGTLVTGPTPDGGYRIVALLPWQDAAS